MKLEKLPNLLIVGAQKAGTSTLHKVLAEHSDIFMSREKELNFFTFSKRYKRGLEYYSQSFKSEEDYKFYGESSPGYMCYPNVARRIKQDLGDPKVIIILRDPIKRALSQYWDNRRHLNEGLTFSECVANDLSETFIPGKRGYFSRGVYLKYIQEYEEVFGRSNLFVMVLEDLIANPKVEISNLLSFLNLDYEAQLNRLPKAQNQSIIYMNPLYSFFLDHPNLAVRVPKRLRRIVFFGRKEKYKYPMPSSHDLFLLREFYKPWNKQLEQYLNRDLSSWNLSNPR